MDEILLDTESNQFRRIIERSAHALCYLYHESSGEQYLVEEYDHTEKHATLIMNSQAGTFETTMSYNEISNRLAVMDQSGIQISLDEPERFR